MSLLVVAWRHGGLLARCHAGKLTAFRRKLCHERRLLATSRDDLDDLAL
jgi:hypothetical protein